ncbi:MAG: hypothetical protein ICV79_25100 [Flavisolibacter sp.]|nr:hypothetical protein [Flavisolibacter sp.]
MKRILISLFVIMVLAIAYFTKPDNKTCIIEAVKAVWGEDVPPVTVPEYYEQFMDEMSQSVEIDDWWVLKRIRYRVNDKVQGTVGFGAFKRVLITYKRKNK